MDDPAYHIPLDQRELSLIGEICAIQGQIEFLLQRIVWHLLETSLDTATRIMGSASLRTNAEIFVRLMTDKCKDATLVSMAIDTFQAFESLTTGRNDFVHAVYGRKHDHGDGISLHVFEGHTESVSLTNIVAQRTSNQKTRTVGDIQDVRNQAAVISCRLAHIHASLLGVPSPWSDRF